MEAVIVRTYPYRESDLIIRVISESGEKRSLIARANRASRRFGTTLDLFDHGIFETKISRGSLTIVSSFKPVTSYRVLREKLSKFATASFVCESVDFLVPDDAGTCRELYQALILGLRAISESHSTKDELRSAYLSVGSLLEAIGYGYDKQRQPGVHSLHALMSRIEELAERKLSTRNAIEDLMKALTPTGTSDAT